MESLKEERHHDKGKFAKCHHLNRDQELKKSKLTIIMSTTIAALDEILGQLCGLPDVRTCCRYHFRFYNAFLY